MKKILINIYKDTLHLIIFKNKHIYNHLTEAINYSHKKTNIYLGKIISIKHSFEAVFVDYGTSKYGFLPLSEMIKNRIENKKKNNKNNYLDEQLIQIIKEEKGLKGVNLTNNISLIGYFIILLPYTKNIIGISKKIIEKKRQKLRILLKKINIPANSSIILRTTTHKATLVDISLDLSILLEQWDYILNNIHKHNAPSLVYHESNKIIQTLRDTLKNNISEILVSNTKIFKLTKHYIKYIQLTLDIKLKFLKTNENVFKKFYTQTFLKNTLKFNIILPSGGTLIIDKTEALIAIDINSAKTKCIDSENTALKTNKEAIDEIAKQCRIKNLNGLIVIDLIDMPKKYNNFIEKRLLNAVKDDKAKIKIGKISTFFLLEITRQRVGTNTKKNLYQKNLSTNVIAIIKKYLKNKVPKTQKNINIVTKIPFVIFPLLFSNIIKLITNIEKSIRKQILIYPHNN